MHRFVGTRRGRLDDAEKRTIIATANRPLTLVAERMDRHPSTVHFARVMLGVAKPPQKRQQNYQRNGRAVRSFSEHEDEFMQHRRIAGDTCAAIATAMTEKWGHPRTAATIGIRLRQLALREDD